MRPAGANIVTTADGWSRRIMTPMPGMGRLILISAIACLLPHVVWAQLARVGGEFQINANVPTSGSFVARVAGFPDGGFVVIWASGGQGGDGIDFGRVFGADGQPSSPEFQVNTSPIASQLDVHVAAAGDGTFVVVWSEFPDRSTVRIMGQRFDRAGDRLGSEFEVVDDDFSHIFAPNVAATAGDEFVVVWAAESGPIPFDLHWIRGRILDSNAQPTGPSFSISGIFSFAQTVPAVASGRDDSLIVVWHSDLLPVGAIRGRILNPPSAIGPEFTIEDVTELTLPEICSHQDGAFVVAWSTYGSSLQGQPDDRLVFYRRYDNDGNALTPALRVTSDQGFPLASLVEWSPDLACGPQRQTVIAWTDARGVRGRVFPDDSLPGSSEFRMNSGFATSIGGAVVAMLDQEDFVLIFQKCDTPFDCNVFGQRFTLRGPTDCTGDCDHNGVVTVDELLTAVNIALGSADVPMSACLPADANLDYSVSIDELVTAVDHALLGCS
jgi:hypothetical protein